MKFYMVTNDILKVDEDGNPTVTDEPKFIQHLIEEWELVNRVGGRIWCTEDGRESLIASPVTITHADCKLLNDVEANYILSLAFPAYTNENGEVKPSPTIEHFENRWVGK